MSEAHGAIKTTTETWIIQLERYLSITVSREYGKDEVCLTINYSDDISPITFSLEKAKELIVCLTTLTNEEEEGCVVDEECKDCEDKATCEFLEGENID